MNTRIETKHLFSENTSPNIKRLILMKRSGLELSERDLEKLERFNESVSMVQPTKYHHRLSPTSHLTKTFGSQKSIEDMDEDDEIDLDEILREMGYEDEYDYSDEDDISEDELQKILNDLEGESLDENFTVNPNSKGYKEGMKLVNDLRRGLFRKLDNDELDEFMGVLKMSFNLK